MKFIAFFFLIQLINVILNTLRTCITAKGNKIAATIVTSICYGFYTFVIVYTANDYSVWVKAAITVVSNLIGVYFSMWLLEKIKKDKLWEIVVHTKQNIDSDLKNENVHYYTNNCLDNTYVYHIFSENQKKSTVIKKILDNKNLSYIVHEQNVKL